MKQRKGLADGRVAVEKGEAGGLSRRDGVSLAALFGEHLQGSGHGGYGSWYARASMESRTLQAIVRLTTREWLRIAAARGAAMDESPDKQAALADVVRALDRLGAPHAVVDSVAVGIRSGVPRATVDTVIAVRSTIERGAIIEALTGAGLRVTGMFAHRTSFRHPSGEPVQIVCDPEFDPMIDRAEPLDMAGLRIRVVTTPDLIAMKERAASDPARRRSKALRDQADIALLRGDVPDPDEGW